MDMFDTHLAPNMASNSGTGGGRVGWHGTAGFWVWNLFGYKIYIYTHVYAYDYIFQSEPPTLIVVFISSYITNNNSTNTNNENNSKNHNNQNKNNKIYNEILLFKKRVL